MALIGTVSGSVSGGSLTSTTAISGTLVISDSPPSSFPVLAAGVKLFVSGNKTQLGADTPNAIFGGDTFVSGAFGTDSYIQMKPVNTLLIPTNTTASYIYTSGSTNDLYFTQYRDPYTNTTRLRWLEGVLTTGLLHGGIVSTANGTTTFSVTAGSGLIVTPNATTTEDPYPTIKLVEWPTFTSSSLEYSGSAQVSYITINASSELVQLNTPPTLAQFKDRIVLGRVLHQTGSVTNGAVNAPAMAFSAAANIFDFVRPFGPLKVSGHLLAASGSTLGLTKTAGDSYAEGRNYAFDPSNPNTILSADDPALVNCKIYYQYVSGSTTVTNTGVANAGFTVIDPAQYNNNGTLAAVANSEWTNQRVYWFPRSVNRALFVYYGVAKYATLDDAVASINSEAFVEGSNTKDSAIFVGVVSVKGNETDLSNTTTAKITQAGLFRSSFGGGGGGGTTPPAGSTTQVQFNDAGAFGGDANFTFDNITHALTVVGAITGSRFTSNAAGSLVNGNGQVYLNGASSNRIDFSSQGTGDPAFNAPTAGTKVVLYPAAGASATDYAIGISPATLWQSIPSTDAAMMFKWFGGTTTLAALSGSGNMEISGDLAVNGGDITTSAGTFNLVNSTATTVNLGGGASAVNIGAAGSATTFAGNITGSNIVLTGDLTGSNIRLTGDIAVVGGDLTSTAATFNLATNLATQLNVGGTTPVISIGTSTGTSTAGIATGTNTVAATIKTVNIGTGTGAAATVNVNIGSSGSLGRTTLNNDVALTTGNLIGAPGAGNNVMSLISSGNLLAKMDANNDGAGHKFAVLDYRDIEQFTVFENGNAELSGSLVVSGSSIQTVTTTTYNLLTTALTGTLNFGSLANAINIGGSVTTSSVAGDLSISGRSTLATTIERVLPSVGGTGTVAFDTTQVGIFYVNNPAGDITANFTNVPTTNNRILTPTIILSQSSTARTISAVQIDASAQTINWANGVTPTGTANKQDVFGFSLIRSGSAWKVLGQLSTYG
jgi:hypothetical protein